MATSKHYSHLTLEMRKSIENYVIEGRTLAYMASEIGVDATSISRELKRNRRCDGARADPSSRNRCAHRRACSVRHLCGPGCARKCSACARMCADGRCPRYEKEVCPRTHRAPWVCNGCGKRTTCPLERFTYSAKAAQAKADPRLSETRRAEMEQAAAEWLSGYEADGDFPVRFDSIAILALGKSRAFLRHHKNMLG